MSVDELRRELIYEWDDVEFVSNGGKRGSCYQQSPLCVRLKDIFLHMFFQFQRVPVLCF